MGLVWVVLFPAGAIIIRFLNSFLGNSVAKHRMVQLSALVLLLIAGGIGVYLSNGNHAFYLRPPTVFLS
jgi:hypothetical protein